MATEDTLDPSTEHYDASSIFDDVAPSVDEQPAVPKSVQLRALRAVVAVAQQLRLPPADMEVEPAQGEPGEVATSEDAEIHEVLGLMDNEPGGAFTPATSDLELTQSLYNKYKAAAPAPKIVRVDTEESYGKWKDEKRAPYLAELEARLDALEAAVAEHVADHHGGGRMAALERALAEHIAQGHHDSEVLGADVDRARTRALVCGDRVPLSLPPASADKINSWQDGDRIYCSVRLPGPDNKARIATTSTPVQRHVEEVVSYAAAAGVDPFEVMGVLPVLAQVLGGGSLVTQLCTAAPELLTRPEVVSGGVFVGLMKPKSDAGVAAIMDLAQRAKAGDSKAMGELQKIAVTASGRKLMATAGERLALARKRSV